MAKKQRTIDEKITRLRTFNIVAGSLHLIQAVGLGYVLTLLDNQVTFPVTADYLGGPPGVALPAERVILLTSTWELVLQRSSRCPLSSTSLFPHPCSSRATETV